MKDRFVWQLLFFLLSSDAFLLTKVEYSHVEEF